MLSFLLLLTWDCDFAATHWALDREVLRQSRNVLDLLLQKHLGRLLLLLTCGDTGPPLQQTIWETCQHI